MPVLHDSPLFRTTYDVEEQRVLVCCSGETPYHFAQDAPTVQAVELFAPHIISTEVIEIPEGGCSLRFRGCLRPRNEYSFRRQIDVGTASRGAVEEAKVALDAALGLPLSPLLVDPEELAADPDRFADRLIESTGSWACEVFDHSFAGVRVELSLEDEEHVEWGQSRRRIVGFLRGSVEVTPETRRLRYGPLSRWRSTLMVHQMDPPPSVSHGSVSLVGEPRIRGLPDVSPSPPHPTMTEGSQSLESLLGGAAEALEGRQGERALELVLRAWAARPSPEIAELVERLSELIAGERLPLSGSGQELLERWFEVESRGHPSDVPLLLEALSGISVIAHLKECAARLLLRPPDPRIAARAIELMMWFRVDGHRWTLPSVLDLVARARDLPSLKLLHSVIAGGGLSVWESEQLEPRLKAVIEPLLAELQASSPAPFTSTELAAFEALDEALEAKEELRGLDEEQLLEAIIEDPESEGPRLVYADWLIERAHPRGELIALQCREAREGGLAPELEQRLGELLASRSRELLGPLSMVVDPRSCRFDRGMLASTSLFNLFQPLLDHLEGHPLWSQVRSLQLSGADAYFGGPSDPGGLVKFLSHPVFRNLQELRGVSTEVLLQFGQAGSLPSLRRLCWWIGAPRSELEALRGELLASRDLSALPELHIDWAQRSQHSPPRWILESPFVQQVELLQLTRVLPDEIFAEWFSALNAAERRPRWFLCSVARYAVRLERSPGGVLSGLAMWRPNEKEKEFADELESSFVRILGRLPKGSLTKIELFTDVSVDEAVSPIHNLVKRRFPEAELRLRVKSRS